VTPEELVRSLSVGLTHSCCVDIRHVPEAPGYVRTTTLHDGNRVNIEFDVWGMHEGGLYFWAKFETLDQIVSCIEDYLETPISDWRAVGPDDYPTRPLETGTPESHRRFRELLESGGPAMPACGDFRTQSTHWLQFMR
jgi:hypothetical protein